MLAWLIQAEIKHRLLQTAIGRNETKQASWSRRKTEIFSDSELDQIGILGEHAGLASVGLEIDWTIGVGGDGGIDGTLPDGRTVAVKYNHRWLGYVMVEGRDGDTEDHLVDLKADILIGTCGRCDPPRDCSCKRTLESPYAATVYLPGWITREEFLRVREIKDWGLGLRHCVRTTQLHPMWGLMSECYGPNPDKGVPIGRRNSSGMERDP